MRVVGQARWFHRWLGIRMREDVIYTCNGIGLER